METLLIEIHNKNPSEELLKWKHFDNIKIKTYPHNSLNTCKGVVKSHELSLCTLDEIKTNLKDQNVTEIWRIQIKKIRRNDIYKYIYTDFQHSQNSKRNQNWIPKNKCRPLHPKYIKMLQMSEVWTPSRPVYTTTSMQKMWGIWHT